MVEDIFKQHDITVAKDNDQSCGLMIYGYYDCETHPTIGFNISTYSGPVMNLERVEMTKNGKGNCTSRLVGRDIYPEGPNFWVLGQAWLEGKYVDFDGAEGTICAAYLKQ